MSKRTKNLRQKRSKILTMIPNKALRAKTGVTSIKVIGVGGGGGNAVTRMMEGERLKGVEFILANTDAQDLNYALAHKKIYMGKALTHGLGAGMNPDIGKQAAEENRSELSEAIEGADMIFITAGMGGGTGTGASPVIAEIAREKGILTTAIVTKPFSFEGTQRMNIAQEGLMRLKEKVDTLIIIPNDRVFSVIDKDTSIVRAFSYIDDILRNAVQGIAEIINTPGIINVDFADIRTIMKDAGTAIFGIGVAFGEDRGLKAASSALNSPLLETSIAGARGVLFSIAGGKDLKMFEINEIAKTIAANVDQSARIIFGAYYDRHLKEKSIKVTVIATGFNGAFAGLRFEAPTLFRESSEKADFLEELYKKKKTIEDNENANAVSEKKVDKKQDESDKKFKKDLKEKEGEPEENIWDIPSFLRKKDKREKK